jgi:protein SCO1/2
VGADENIMDKKTLQVGVIAFLVIAVIAAVTIFMSQPDPFRGTMYGEPFPPAPAIELAKADGSTFRLSDQKGKIILLFFGYTSCPDVCPTTLAELKLVMDEFGDQADSIEVVFVTVDPERDTPQKMQDYANHFNSKFIGLSGSSAQLEKIWSDYGIFRQTVPAENSQSGYSVDHTARVMLIDADGNLRLSYGFQTPVDDIVHDIKLLLK